MSIGVWILMGLGALWVLSLLLLARRSRRHEPTYVVDDPYDLPPESERWRPG